LVVAARGSNGEAAKPICPCFSTLHGVARAFPLGAPINVFHHLHQQMSALAAIRAPASGDPPLVVQLARQFLRHSGVKEMIRHKSS
jgi:hypothetical protein